MSEASNPEEEAGTKGAKGGRSYAERAQRSLKDADRVLKQNPDREPEAQATVQLEQAKVWALLDLADAIRKNGTS